MEFISDNTTKILKTIIDNALAEMYPKLNSYDTNILNEYLLSILIIFKNQYNLNDDIFNNELIQNDYKNIKWISTFLLPYLNDTTDLKSFQDMYLEKSNEMDMNLDINKCEPHYKFTNLQYGRCKRTKVNNTYDCEEIVFSYDHLEHNYKLFLETMIVSSNKLYVNWMNIIPVAYKDLDKNITYRNTEELFGENNIKEFDIIEYTKTKNITQLDKKILGSLYVGDIYNTIRNYLYEEIKEIKLIIYDVVILPIGKKSTAISVLNEIFVNDKEFYLVNALNNISWLSLSNQSKNKFTEIWYNILNSYLNNIDVFVKNVDFSLSDQTPDFYNISKVSITRLMKGLSKNFDKRFGDKKKIINSGYVKLKMPKKMEAEDFDDDEENIEELLVENVNESLKSIKPNYIYEFFRDILQQFKTTIYSSYLLNKDKTDFLSADIPDISYKNLYNYAKSFSSYTKNNKFTQFDKHWCSLDSEEKEIILKRLNDQEKKIMSWFNIGNYIKSLLDAGYIDDTFRKIKDINTDIYYKIRQTLISHIFNCLVLKGVLSTFVPMKNDIDKSYFVKDLDNKYASDAYYYLTEVPYLYSGELLDILSQDSWYTMQAMVWVSQIGFCHHFINNRISYVTGATGVGKSTHVPKLYMYFLKAIDYKSIGKIICTQPRRTPTEKGADEVSKQLGLPIIKLNTKGEPELDENGEKIPSLYYSVQMQHQTKKHIRDEQKLILKFITDGSLVQEFRNILPVFKKLSKDRKTITKQNLYDVVIVDEAHEHNKNMDILLTLLKIYAYHNPSLRVVILSATVDEDEPNYRRFYRGVNDNMKYPYNMWIQNNNIDRINVDRRFHISAPGTGTRFEIKEYYRDGYDIVTQIEELIRTNKGDILVFQSGEGDIIRLIETLNKKIPDNWIALPFYSNMKGERRNFIENIDFTFPSLRINKDADFDKVKSLEEGNGRYTNFVLVATNIAEASITIKRLYYVVDIGIRKSNYYSFNKKNNILLSSTITETSRVQRKGRVGRTGPGEVYFLYKKGITESNKTPYEISISNISNDIYIKLRNNVDEKKFSINEYENLKDMYNTNKELYSYIGNRDHNDYDYEEYIPEYYETGFSLEDLMDNTGKFYIVHPDELDIKRNILGKIIESKVSHITIEDKINGIIRSKKMESFIDDFTINNFYIKDDQEKTELGINITEIIDKFKLDSVIHSKALIYSLLLKSSDKLLLGITLMNIIKSDIFRIFNRDKDYDTPIVKILKQQETSDIEVIINLCIKFLDYINNKTNILDIKELVESQRLVYDKFTINGISININDLINIFNDYETDEDDDNLIDRETIFDYFVSHITKLIKTSNVQKHIDYFCKLYSIDSKLFTKFLEAYIKLKDIINSLYYTDKKGKTYKTFINKYTEIFTDKYRDFDNIKLPFILSQPYNLMYSIKGTESFLPVYYPTTDNIVSIGTTMTYDKNIKKYIKTILFDPLYINGYCWYESYNADRDVVSNIIAIDKTYVKLFDNIYRSHKIKKILVEYSSKINKPDVQKYVEKNIALKKFKVKLPLYESIISNVGSTYTTLIEDLK